MSQQVRASASNPPANQFDPSNPFFVQSDRSVLVEVDNAKYAAARDALAPFAELEKSPEHVHTYRMSNLSLWNAAAAGMTADEMIAVLRMYSKFPLPANISTDLTETVGRYGRLKLDRDVDGELSLLANDQALLTELAHNKKLREYLGERLPNGFRVQTGHRGIVKQLLITIGYPAEDLAGYTDGKDLAMELRQTCRSGVPFVIRDYQRESADVFFAGGDRRGGSGVIVLPCGAGKTIVGINAMTLLQKSTLVLTTSITAVKQWVKEILDKTTLSEADVKEYTGDTKEIGDVTVATYQIVTYRPGKKRKKSKKQLLDMSEDELDELEAAPDDPANYPHFKIFEQRDWGLIIYDEVHLLPAPVFRVTAQIQARRRLGLTATLIREDGREGDVFTLIGPKKYDVPWRELEAKGWIATANCTEVRVSLPDETARLEYAVADWRNKYRIASENSAKTDLVGRLLEQNADQRVIVIGQYLDQLKRIAARYDLPLITGSTANRDREELYGKFRSGEIRHIVLSKVGNFAIDLPDANVLIQVSGTFGSRQEEAQRLGRVLRPKGTDGGTAHFYTLVTRDTRELDFAHHRQMFLTEQGYSYEIIDSLDVLPVQPEPTGVSRS